MSEKRLIPVSIIAHFDDSKLSLSLFIGSQLVAGLPPNLKSASARRWMVPEDKLQKAIQGEIDL